MRSRWSVRVLLPAAISLAEGSWLAVLYAALQGASSRIAYLGPVELGALVIAGAAFGRRRRRASPAGNAALLVILIALSGIFGWLLDPDVRAALLDGDVLGALRLHVPGWLAAGAFWRGAVRPSAMDDAVIDHRLLRVAVPALALPWLLGYAVASGQSEHDFAAAALVATIFFVGSAFAALGLARLEALRLSTVGDWSGDRSWIFMILGLALVLTVLTLPVAALLGIPAPSLLGAIVGPLETLFLIVVTITLPIFLLAAVLADWISALLPGFHLSPLKLPTLHFARGDPTSSLPGIILTVIVAGAFLLDFLVLVAMAWVSFRGRRRRQDFVDPTFEERAIVDPGPAPPEPPPAAPVLSRHFANDPTGTYLAALDALAADGRWPRRAHETPAAHLQRARAEGLPGSAFARLAAAYQLARYGLRPLPSREENRAPGRLRALLGVLGRSQDS